MQSTLLNWWNHIICNMPDLMTTIHRGPHYTCNDISQTFSTNNFLLDYLSWHPFSLQSKQRHIELFSIGGGGNAVQIKLGGGGSTVFCAPYDRGVTKLNLLLWGGSFCSNTTILLPIPPHLTSSHSITYSYGCVFYAVYNSQQDCTKGE